jgi:hypothetical protein
MIKRRTFIAGLGSAVAWPMVAWAHQAAVPVIGLIHPETPDLAEYLVRAFRQGAIKRLVSAILLEQNDEWAVKRSRFNDPIVKLPAVAA